MWKGCARKAVANADKVAADVDRVMAEADADRARAADDADRARAADDADRAIASANRVAEEYRCTKRKI